MSFKLLDTVPDFTQDSRIGCFSLYEKAAQAWFPQGCAEHTPHPRMVKRLEAAR